MTKTLTEQWREGKLPDGCYYVKFYTAKTPYIEVYGSGFLQDLAEFNGTDRAEVLAPVPCYEEWKKLDDELKELATKNDTLAMENGRLQEQIKDAEHILDEMGWADRGLIDDYFEKWGVK